MEHAFPTLLLPLVYILLRSNPCQATSATPSVERAYCSDERNIECDTNEVVIIESAYYGIFRRGECGTPSNVPYHTIPCQFDVTVNMTRHCSGHQSCTVQATSFGSLRPCGGYISYLKVSHHCLQVTHVSEESCLQGQVMKITSPDRGYLVNPQQDNSGLCDGEITHYKLLLEAGDGQTILLRMTDFSTDGSTLDHNRCTIYMRIKDMAWNHDIPICGEREMEREILQSSSSSAGVEFHQLQHRRFLLYYEFQGCTDLGRADGVTFTRTGQTAIWTCHLSDMVIDLRCNGTAWSPEPPPCGEAPSSLQESAGTTQSTSKPTNPFAQPVGSFPWEVMVVLVAIITVGIVVCVLIVGVVCVKSSRARHQQHPALMQQQSSEPVYALYDISASLRGGGSRRDATQESIYQDLHCHSLPYQTRQKTRSADYLDTIATMERRYHPG